jgi:hypothetical protein
VVGSGENGIVRFIGIDGYRWMIRCVVNGTEDTIDVAATEARKALADTVVSRGDTQLPEAMTEQLRQVAAQQAAAQEGQQEGQQQGEPPQPAPRRVAPGSAMQQLRTTMGGA